MKYLYRLMNFGIILSFCLMNMNCVKDNTLLYKDNFVLKINGISMNPSHIACTQANGLIGVNGSGSAYDLLFIIPEDLADGKYPLSSNSTIICTMFNGVDLLIPDDGELRFSNSSDILNGSFTFKIDETNDTLDVYGYFNLKIVVIEE